VVCVRRIPWQLPAAIVLLVLFAALATFQYRWLGEVSEAERERMRATLRTRASDFSREFDAELTRVFIAFQMDRDRLDADAAAALGGAYANWRAATATPSLVRGVYVVEGMTPATSTLRRFDRDRQTLEPVEWPPEFAGLRRQPPQPLPQMAGLPPPLLMSDALEADIPALIIPAPHLTTLKSGDQFMVRPTPGAPGRVLIVWLDSGSLTTQLLEPLVAKHFGEGPASDYVVTIVRRDDPSTVVFSSAGQPVERAAADVTTGVFDLRIDEVSRLSAGRGLSHGPGVNDRFAITIVRRANAASGERTADDRRRRAGRLGTARAAPQRVARGDCRAVAAAQHGDQPRRAGTARREPRACARGCAAAAAARASADGIRGGGLARAADAARSHLLSRREPGRRRGRRRRSGEAVRIADPDRGPAAGRHGRAGHGVRRHQLGDCGSRARRR
jgi:hypothetical protein